MDIELHREDLVGTIKVPMDILHNALSFSPDHRCLSSDGQKIQDHLDSKVCKEFKNRSLDLDFL